MAPDGCTKSKPFTSDERDPTSSKRGDISSPTSPTGPEGLSNVAPPPPSEVDPEEGNHDHSIIKDLSRSKNHRFQFDRDVGWSVSSTPLKTPKKKSPHNSDPSGFYFASPDCDSHPYGGCDDFHGGHRNHHRHRRRHNHNRRTNSASVLHRGELLKIIRDNMEKNNLYYPAPSAPTHRSHRHHHSHHRSSSKRHRCCKRCRSCGPPHPDAVKARLLRECCTLDSFGESQGSQQSPIRTMNVLNDDFDPQAPSNTPDVTTDHGGAPSQGRHHQHLHQHRHQSPNSGSGSTSGSGWRMAQVQSWLQRSPGIGTVRNNGSSQHHVHQHFHHHYHHHQQTGTEVVPHVIV